MAELRARTGRPQWLLIDEAHHVLPETRGDLWRHLAESLPATILVTVSPNTLASEVIKTVDVVLAFGRTAPKIPLDVRKNPQYAGAHQFTDTWPRRNNLLVPSIEPPAKSSSHREAAANPYAAYWKIRCR